MQLNYRCSCLFPSFLIASIDLKFWNPLKMWLEDCEFDIEDNFRGHLFMQFEGASEVLHP
jgi:hypothetical protein